MKHEKTSPQNATKTHNSHRANPRELDQENNMSNTPKLLGRIREVVRNQIHEVQGIIAEDLTEQR